jgi:NADP-dependent aldehyde dehydrogenase
MGKMLIGGEAVLGTNGKIQGFNPAANEPFGPEFGGATRADLTRACALAGEAFNSYRNTSLEERALFLEDVAARVAAQAEKLVPVVMAETGLPRPRVEGELGRTVGQLRLFAATVREGSFMRPRIDPALPDRKPMPRADLRLRFIGVGPVAVFGASNFPLAFSVAGGDTASALAAGCPVVVKAHSAHPGTSALVGEAIQAAVKARGLHEGVFSMIFSADRQINIDLVTDPNIKAVGFTGSRGAGQLLMKAAAARPEPIPVFAEMSSINPVILLPAALKARGADIGKAFSASLVLGAGQFCTNPGLLLALEGADVEAFAEAAGLAVKGAAASTMLTTGIHSAYQQGIGILSGHGAVKQVARGQDCTGPNQAQAGLFQTSAKDFLADHQLHAENFGPSSLLVRCKDVGELAQVLGALEGQLTIALHMDKDDYATAAKLMPVLENKAGRILVNGFGTGVEVSHAMVHGGPFPATSDSRATSVGTLAMDRFLRPVCYQDMPQELLPEALRDGNPLGIFRRTDGQLGEA